MNLVYKHEKPLFGIAVTISTLVWLSLILGTFGIALLYILMGYVFFLFAQSAFISHLKGSGVQITPEQYPDLHAKLTASCKKVGLDEVPDAYLLRTDFFNALATRFLGRNFIVLFTDVVDALEDNPNAVDFYIGHELGHIHRKHLKWMAFLMPAMVLPLLGAALRRAEEYTCDRYGVACCESESDIQAAIAAIAAGDTRWQSINVEAYLKQIEYTREFWMSFHELTGDYPWLTKRMATAIAFKRGDENIKHPRRSLLAWGFALFIPRTGAGGGASLLVVVVIVGVLAAVAVPAYQDYLEKSRYSLGYNEALPIKNKVLDYVQENNAWPESMKDLGYASDTLVNEEQKYEIGLYQEGVIGIRMGESANKKGEYIVIEPNVDEGSVTWECYGENASEDFLPKECQ